jgi:hypothetical protein
MIGILENKNLASEQCNVRERNILVIATITLHAMVIFSPWSLLPPQAGHSGRGTTLIPSEPTAGGEWPIRSM